MTSTAPLRDPGVAWPNGARAAAVVTVDLDAELFWIQLDPISAERPKTLSLGEYGPLRGIPRLLRALDDFEVPATFFVPGAAAERYADTLRDIAAAGHEIAAKGYAPGSFVHLGEAEQRASIRRSVDAIERATGERPRGFRSFDDLDGSTLEILVEEGFSWTSALAGDDRPQVQLVDDAGSPTLIDIPALWELNEFRYFGFNYGPAMPTGQNRPASYARVAADWKDEYDAYAEAGTAYVLTLDPQSIGKPGRISVLREVLEHIRSRGDAWFVTAGELAEWWRNLPGVGIPAGAAEQVRRRTVHQIDLEAMSGALRLGLLLGDGIGPEIVPAAAAAADAAAAAAGLEPIEWTPLPMGLDAIAAHGDALPAETLETLETLDSWLLGPHDSVGYPEPHRSRLNPSGTLRTHFDLFANIRPARSLPGANAIVPGTDLVIVRENTEGFYADRNTFRGTGEMMPTPDVAIMHGIITRERSERIAHEAFRIARTRRSRVSIVHKANVLPMSSGLFLRVCEEVAADYPEVAVDDFHVDAMAARLVRRADEFDVIVAENMLGDILSDLTAEIAGSLGLAPSINASLTRAMAQAAHGSAPDIAGRGIANPSAMMLSTAQLLRWLGERRGDARLEDASQRIETAVESVIATGPRTGDLGGTAGTEAFTAAVIARIDDPTAGGSAG